MALLLFADDDPGLREAMGLALSDAGHEVHTAADGEAALARFDRLKPDLLLADVNMPRLDGFALCRRLRARGEALPILILTARDSEIDEALGLELGADDYVTKPVSPRVLGLRVGALLRRAQALPAPVAAQGLHLDPLRLEAAWNGHSLPVTLTEFKLLEALVARPGVVLSRDTLLERMIEDSAADPRVVDTYVRRLRRKLEGLDPRFDRIETRVGAGYRWRA